MDKSAISPFQNPDLPLEDRIDDLLAKLEFEEKLSMFGSFWPMNERLGLPAVRFGGECLHGLCHTGRATVFPSPIALAATFDPDSVRQVADAISTEARAKINDPAWGDSSFLSLAFWTPNINLFRDPRWGRGQETYGEDPFLAGEMGLAFVRGLQGDDPRYLKTAACAKHLAVHSGPEAIRTSFNAEVSPKLLHETYLPHFKRLVDGGVAVVMGAYNALNGEPCCGSRSLLTRILREQWGFEGFVVSDAGAIAAFHRKKRADLRADEKGDQWGFLAQQMAELEGHGLTADETESAARALTSGCDMALGSDMSAEIVRRAHERGLVTEADMDTALGRVLRVVFRLGVFDPEERRPFRECGGADIQSPAHIRLARQAAAKGAVLLKNNGVLPLGPDVKSVAVSGPTAADIEVLLGNFYRGVSSNLKTIVEGVVEAAPEGTRVTYLKGAGLNQPDLFESTWSIGMAETADVVVACVGNSPLMEGEHGECIGTTLGGDRDRVDLPEVQTAYLRRLKEQTGKPLVAVVTSGSPIILSELHELADAVLLAWYPGEQGGSAVGEILFGRSEPGGRLPVTFPRDESQIPDFADYSMRGRGYRYLEEDPLYPFGFGLGYTRFEYGELTVSAEESGTDESITLSLEITNVGERAGESVPQLYLADQGDTDGPRCNLRAFRRVRLEPGAGATVEFKLDPSAFERFDAAGRAVPGTGAFTLTVADGAPGKRAQALGAPGARSVVCQRRRPG
ncbi:MAG: glycoside hydrolase family 3 C-terminal domain-containing protein [Opitutales bacterium]